MGHSMFTLLLRKIWFALVSGRGASMSGSQGVDIGVMHQVSGQFLPHAEVVWNVTGEACMLLSFQEPLLGWYCKDEAIALAWWICQVQRH